jgi:hypothetical protein
VVALLAEKPQQLEPSFPRIPASAPPVAPRRPRLAYSGEKDTREAARKTVALKCWLQHERGAARGYAMDLSERGARLSGVGYGFGVGTRTICKVMLDSKEPPLVLRCKVVRVEGHEVGVEFLEVNFDDWFRIARFVDRR